MTFIDFNRLVESEPLVATFDLHGTLLVSNWRTTFRDTYLSFKPDATQEEAARWVDINSPGTDENALLTKLSKFVMKPFEDVHKTLKQTRALVAASIPAQIQTGVMDFLDRLLDIPGSIIYVTTNTKERNVIINEIVGAQLDRFFDESHILNSSIIPSDSKEKFRSEALRFIHSRHPGHKHIFFNDTADGMTISNRLSGINVGVLIGDKPEAGRTQQMITSGAHFIIEDWRQAHPLLALGGLTEGLHLFTNQQLLLGLGYVGPHMSFR